MPNTLLVGGTVVDCTDGAAKKNVSVFVAGDRIAKIGPVAEVKVFADGQGRYKTIDATGKTVMPGMVDCHVHPAYGDVLSIEQLELYSTVEYRTLKGAHNLKKVLRAGVTSIGAPGGQWNINVALRDAVNSGLIEGPRVAAGGHYISHWNGIGAYMPSHITPPISSFAVLCNTRDEFVAEVRKEIKDGVDLIKISGDDDLNGTVHPRGSITLDDMKAITEIVHLMDKKCVIHARSGRAAADAARAGFDWINHCSFLSDEELETIVEHQTPINPSLSLLANSLDWAPEFGAHPAMLDSMKRELEAASHWLSKAHKAGVTIMSGSDSGQSVVAYGEWHAREMEHLVTYLGMSHKDALLAGTRNAALCMPGNEVGTLEEGKLADILVVDGDPASDVTVLQDRARLDAIMKGGEVVDTAEPIVDPPLYSWEVPMVMWSDSRLPDQAFVRAHAKSKPKWMKKKSKAAE